jgi:hypothetical protein
MDLNQWQDERRVGQPWAKSSGHQSENVMKGR